MKLLLAALCVLIVVSSNAQNRSFLKNADANCTDTCSICFETVGEFMRYAEGIWLYPEKLRMELLQASIYYALLEFIQVSESDMRYNNALQCAGKAYTRKFSYSSYDRKSSNNHRFQQNAYLLTRKMNIQDGMVKTITGQAYLLDYLGGPFFRYRDKNSGASYLVYGKRSDTRDSTFLPDPLTHFNYADFGRYLVRKELQKRDLNFFKKQGQVNSLGVGVELKSSSLIGNNLPVVEFVIITASNRISSKAISYTVRYEPVLDY